MNQALVSFGSAERSRAVIERIQRDGGLLVRRHRLHTAMRIRVASWATTETDLERSLEAILRAADAASG